MNRTTELTLAMFLEDAKVNKFCEYCLKFPHLHQKKFSRQMALGDNLPEPPLEKSWEYYDNRQRKPK